MNDLHDDIHIDIVSQIKHYAQDRESEIERMSLVFTSFSKNLPKEMHE